MPQDLKLYIHLLLFLKETFHLHRYLWDHIEKQINSIEIDAEVSSLFLTSVKLQTRFSSRSDELLYDFYNQIKWFVTNLWPDFTMAEIIDLEDMDYDSIYSQEGDPQYRMGPTPNSMSDG